MRSGKLVFVFLVVIVSVLPKAEASVFFDDFDDGDMSDWTITTNGIGAVFEDSLEKCVSLPYSVHMNSPEGLPAKQAMGVSPSFDPILELSENYHVSFSFLIPDTNNHWFEVFNNHQTYLVIDSGDDLKCYDGSTSYLIDELATNEWHHIEIKVHPASEDYGVYVDEKFKKTCPFWIHTGLENSFRIGDRENGTSDYGQAYWDDFVITQPVDSDGDGIMDPNDNCPYVANPDQADRNLDGWGDRCECIAANDGNDSGHVDLEDFALIALSWKQSDQTAPGDINGNGTIDFNDLEILAYHWLSDCCHQRWAVIVGISDYNDIADVNYADDDASDWYNYLVGLGYENIWVFGDEHAGSYPQYDGLATEENIRTRLEYVATEAEDDDIIAFVFSGHGGGDGDGNSYLAAWDSNSGGGGYDGDLYDSELRSIFSTSPARLFFFFDSCRSGGMLDDLSTMQNASNVYATSGCTEDGSRNELDTYSNGAWNYWFLEAGLIGEYNSIPATTMEECFDWADSKYNPGGADEPTEFDGALIDPFILW